MSDPVHASPSLNETTPQPSSIQVLGIPLFAETPKEAVQRVIRVCEQNRETSPRPLPLRISATGAHGLIHARSDAQFRDALRSCWINLPDGMPGVWIGRCKGARQMERCYGPDFFSLLVRRTADRSVTHFLCGGGERVAEQLKHTCEEFFGNHRIAGTLSPPYRDVDDFDYPSIGAQIDASGADIVWIGLSTPKQELFAQQLAGHCNATAIVTVGAAFDFHTGRIPRAPSWMQRSGLEWLFRLLSEPKRLWRRYAVIVPSFLWLATIDLIRWRLARRTSGEPTR
ncbi:MAG: WecB/TagA/CpsF family glycosyltransferase [Balneolaceae bacterium]